VSEIQHRRYRPGDEEAINQGFNDVFGLQRSLAEWHWKFAVEPEGRWIMLGVGEHGRVLAHYGAVPVRLQAGTLEVRAGQIVDVYSRPEARTGLATARAFLTTVDTFIRELCTPDQLALCYGFPSGRPLKLGSLRSGYTQMPPQRVHMLRRPAQGRGLLLHFHRVGSGFDPAAVDQLWQRARNRYAIAARRDAAWLRRRLTGRPGVEYTHLVAWRRGAPAACAVVRAMGKFLQWVELVWDGEDVRALAALDRRVAAIARAAGCERMEMWLDGDRAATEALVALGWDELENPEVRLVVHSFHSEIDPASVPGRFYLTMSDADLI
jgi:hypothetical protein